MLELIDVWKIYRMGKIDINALRGVNLKVKLGEFLAVMGPSGSGKSTLMNMIGCLDVPSKGSIYLDGHDISKLYESDLAQLRGRKIGFVFQQFNLIPTLTAIENVMLPMIFQNIKREERVRKAEKLLDIVKLGDRRYHRPTELSGGQQQRVAIARSLCNDPEILLADEPTGNLDSTTGQEFMQFLRKLHTEEGKTIIMVTHDREIAKNADRTEFLKDGKIAKNI
ncbi:ABC transporter ATP-binding protein [Candidatus Woesearchaeota archaeon]|nr:ABC transporter ATP-binding protein [Candidatus Woesearchaeota archaeon]